MGEGDGPFRVEPVSSARGGSELCSVTKLLPPALYSSPGTVHPQTRDPCQMPALLLILLHNHAATMITQESIPDQNGRPYVVRPSPLYFGQGKEREHFRVSDTTLFPYLP